MAGYIGNYPTAVPLTSADLTDGIITSAKLANDAVVTGKIADGTIVNADINTSAGILTSKLSGSLGITEADQWRYNTSLTLSSNTFTFITSNWERNDTTFDKIGTGMTESSGVFAFPETGIYLVTYNVNIIANSKGDIRAAGGDIYLTTNNSSYSIIAEGFNGCNNHGLDYFNNVTISAMIDVTDTSTHKVKFDCFSSVGGAQLFGDTNYNRTTVTFIRLGTT